MKTPLELLEKELTALRFIASIRDFSAKKKEAKILIPQYELAIKILKENLTLIQ